jgi:ABC-type antimicrobial peptide transport system permease subunit
VPDLADDEAVINQWLAEDLGAKVGDTLTLAYWIVGPLRKLEEHTTTFTIKQVVPMNHPLCDPGLMPDIPGLSDKKDCREWEPGVPIDLDKIRDKDQAYWTTYKGTPKAFLSLRAGQKIWNNRFGNLTAVRYAASVGNTATVTACLRQALSPASQGVFFQPVRENALAAVAQSLDFGLLFLGFSLFLIVAALLLCALLFAFGIEQRREEMGILLALGIPARRVRQWFLWEGGAVALVASVIGVLLATLYTRAVVQGLSGVWQDAVVSTPLRYYASPLTLAIGGLVSFLMALATIAFVTRRQAQSSARELLTLTESVMPSVTERKRLPGAMTAIGAGVFAALLLAGTGQAHGETVLGLFFGAGMCLLTAGLSAARMLLAILERGTTLPLSLPQLALRNAVRRAGRSVGAMALLACGSFLVIAVGANRHDPNEEAYDQRSGTGGFALYGEASLPLYDAESLRGKNFVAFRLREGDEASCLNLNRAQTPRLLGVNPAQLQKRFTFSQPMTGGDWSLLTKPVGDAIPVIGDSNTVMWALGKKVGDVISYKDEHGVAQKLQIVGVIGNSVLQGGLILSEANFLRLFPSASGYQVFLFDAEKTAAVMLAQELTQDLEDNGMSITPTGERLAAFNTVENVYLSIFAVLGGLGLILGSVGLGVLLLRNVYERRSELALLRAVGYSTGALQALLFREHALLLVSGLGIGAVSGLVAVLPSLRSPGAQVPYLSLTLTLLLVFLSGFVWTWLASVVALRRPLLAALRAE